MARTNGRAGFPTRQLRRHGARLWLAPGAADARSSDAVPDRAFGFALRRESLLFACAKRSNQEKHTPGLRALAALGFPAMLAGPAGAETRGAAHRSNSQRRTAPGRLRFSALRKGEPEENSKARLARDSAVAFAVRVPLGRTEQRSARREWPARTAGQVVVAAGMPRRRRSRAREQRRALRAAKCGPRGVLSFAYFSLHKQRKVRRAIARNESFTEAIMLGELD